MIRTAPLLVTFLALGACVSPAAEHASTTAPMHPIAHQYLAAIQAMDWVTMESLLAPGARYQDLTMEYYDRDAIDLNGSAAIARFWMNSSRDSATDSIRYDVREHFQAGPCVLVIATTHVRVGGAYWHLEQESVDVQGTLIVYLKIVEGRVVHHMDFVDYGTAMKKIDAARGRSNSARKRSG